MINRRDFAASIGIGTIGALTALSIPAGASARTAPAPVQPPKGPWTSFGQIQRAGGILHYAEIGPKDSTQPPIILLHKLGGWLSDWRFVAPLLAEGRRVIAFDLPGHGGSHWASPPPYIQTLGETAALLVGALEEMGIAQIDLIGTSLGGCLSVPLAGYWPDKVRKLALVSCALNIGHDLTYIRKNVDEGQRNLYDAKGYPVPTPPELLTQIFGIINAKTINDEGILSRRAAGLWIQPSERGVGLADIQALLRRVEAPTLLLYGDRDKAYVKFQKAASAALKTSKTQYVPDAGAFVMQDNPAATAKILRDF
ncbi:MAG: alpha/beta fold hydrolase, partial [Sphingobium sp.]